MEVLPAGSVPAGGPLWRGGSLEGVLTSEYPSNLGLANTRTLPLQRLFLQWPPTLPSSGHLLLNFLSVLGRGDLDVPFLGRKRPV